MAVPRLDQQILIIESETLDRHTEPANVARVWIDLNRSGVARGQSYLCAGWHREAIAGPGDPGAQAGIPRTVSCAERSTISLSPSKPLVNQAQRRLRVK